MRYENFDKVKKLMQEIDAHKEVLKNLDNATWPEIEIRSNRFHVVSIPAYGENNNHFCGDIAHSFYKLVKEYYQDKVDKLMAELAPL